VDLARSLGADAVIDYTQQDFTRNGETYDIIFDAVGKRSFAECQGSLTPDGVYMATVPTLRLFANVLRTARLGRKKARVSATGMRSPGDKAKDLHVLRDLAEAGRFRPVVDSVYPMARIAEAHRRVESGRKTGSVVMTLGE
jgi:NADPH:quinone reductase-like Zn-dependent oxidoreductase